MSSRFDAVTFDDFTEQELESIWKKICNDKGYLVHDKVSSVVRRRLSKQRGREGFSNARAVRTMFEKASLSATHRYREENDEIDSKPPSEQPRKRPELEIIVEDVIGERPTRDSHPKVIVCLLCSCSTFCSCLFAVERHFGRSRFACGSARCQKGHVCSYRHHVKELGPGEKCIANRGNFSQSRVCRQPWYRQNNSGEIVRASLVRDWHAQQR